MRYIGIVLLMLVSFSVSAQDSSKVIKTKELKPVPAKVAKDSVTTDIAIVFTQAEYANLMYWIETNGVFPGSDILKYKMFLDSKKKAVKIVAK